MGERSARALFRLLLRLLPGGFHRRAGDELLEVFTCRLRSARGLRGAARVLLVEAGGVLAAAVRARLDPELRGGRRVPGRRPLEWLVQDVRFAARGVARRPGSALLVVATLGLGVGASTAMFSVVDAVLVRPLPFPDPHEVVSVYTTNPELAGHPTMAEGAERGWLSGPEHRALRDEGGDVLEGLALLRSGGVLVQHGGEAERILVGGTNADLFSRVLRVAPVAGRLFQDESGPDGREVLLSEGYWTRRFAADPTVVGSALHFEETPYTIVGVLPAHARLSGYAVDVWTLWSPGDDWDDHHLTAVGRLAPGVTAEAAAEHLTRVLAAALPGGHQDHAVNVFPRLGDETRGVRGSIWLLGLSSLLLLAVACVNAAALLVSLGIDRERELAVRSALGAGRRRLVGQLLVESVLLALLAAAAGALLALAGTRGLVFLAPEGVPRIGDASVDGRALAFAASAALVSGLLSGLLPALDLARRSTGLAVPRVRGSAGEGARLQGSLVVAELALATVLLVGAGLFGRTLLALNAVDLGFAASETLALRVTVPSARLFQGVDMSDGAQRAEAVDAFYRSLIEPIEALPGVGGVAVTSVLPLAADRTNSYVYPDGDEDARLIAERRAVSPNYFSVLGIRMVEGRPFSPEEDRPGAAGTVVVSESLARSAWPGESAVGKRVDYFGGPTMVVGVAADIHDEQVESGTAMAFYLPRRQSGEVGGALVLRTTGDARALVPAVRQRVREVDAGIAVNFLRPLSDFASEQIADRRYRARLILVFSLLATFLSLLGVYGVTARSVAARTRELGIRTALGAPIEGLVAQVLRRALRLALAGAAAGTAVCFVAARSIEAYLWGVGRTDLTTLVGAGVLLAGAAVASALVPALRAARVDPADALRNG